MPVTVSLHFPQVVNGFMVQNQLAVMVELTAFHIVRGVFFHLLTPDLRENEKIKLLIPLLSLAAIWYLRPAPKNRRKQQISPGRS